MNLSLEVYPIISQIDWFSRAGHGSEQSFRFSIAKMESKDAALAGFASDLWADVKTEAQGDLTGYLAKNHYSSYGSYWNSLAKQSRVLVEKSIGEGLKKAIQNHQWPASMEQPILVDINRYVLEFSFRKKFPNAPVFFEYLFDIYRSGHLPCGWNGEMKNWPKGEVAIF